MDYKKENNAVLENVFNRTFFESWKQPRNNKDKNVFRGLEIYLTSDCNLGCKYCYLNRFEKELYPEELRDEKEIINNLDLLLDYLIENSYTPKIDIFSGAGIESKIGIDALNLIYKKYSETSIENRPTFISIPTNFTFILQEGMTEKIEDFIDKFAKIDIRMGLSISIDGKYMEQNRPFRNKKRIKSEIYYPENGDPRDDDYYDKVFEFAKKHGAGFHPMVYSHSIEKWKDNFLWFQEMFEKHEIPFDNIYLLEIRNAEWTQEQLYEYSKFLDFLIDWTHEKLGGNPERTADFIMKAGYNTLRSAFLKRYRGISCSLQTTMFLRMSDLKIVPCHRQSYDGYNLGHFQKDEDNKKITNVVAENLEMAIAMLSFDLGTQPYCETCILKEICSGGCIGAQLEINGDPFVPIPTVCDLEFHRHFTIYMKLKELNVWEYIKRQTSADVIETYRKLENMYKEASK